MELKEFIKKVLLDITGAINEANSERDREFIFVDKTSARTIEFDIAVSAEENVSQGGKGGIKVWNFVEAGGNIAGEMKNSTVSRISFGVNIADE